VVPLGFNPNGDEWAVKTNFHFFCFFDLIFLVQYEFSALEIFLPPHSNSIGIIGKEF
jgi:hypothetical protein